MINKIIKTNNLSLSYEMLSDEGKVLKKSQSFSFIPEDSTEEELYSLGTSIGNILFQSPKEIRHDVSYLLVEE